MPQLKKLIKFAWDEFIYGGHLTSIATASIIFTSAILLDIKVTWNFLIIIYLSAYIFLLHNRYKEIEDDISTNFERTIHIKKYIKYVPFLIFFLSFFVIAIVVYSKKISILLFIFLLLLFLGFLYTIILKNFTKKIPAFKTFFISLLGSSLLIFFAIYFSYSFNLSIILIFIFIFLRLFVNTNFFDIKDAKTEYKKGLKTLPIILGEKKLIHFLSVITVISGILILYGLYFELLPKFSLMLLFVVPYTFFYFRYFEKKKKEKSYYIFIDGEFILWSFFILLGKILL